MIQDLRVENPMPIISFLNPIEEDISNHVSWTDEELLEAGEIIEEAEEEEEETAYSLNEY